MKNFQKGFGLVGLLIILGLVIVGSGAFLYVQNKSSAPVNSNLQTATSTTQKPPSSQTVESSLSPVPASGGSPLHVLFYYVLGTSTIDAINFGDGTPVYIFGNEPPYTITKNCSSNNCAISHTYTQAGSYKASLMFTCLDLEGCGAIPDKVFATSNVTVTSSNQSSLVPGMSQYTDKDFGFSFWYPANTTIITFSGGHYHDDHGWVGNQFSIDSYGASTTLVGTVVAPDFVADEVHSPSMSILSGVDPGPFGSYYDKYFFDTQTHTWMYADDGGPTGQKPGGINPADTSQNTMGGLHLFYGYMRFGVRRIIPLSATNFLVINITCDHGTSDVTANKSCDQRYFTSIQTIMATDPSVATPVSAAQQAATIQAEKDAYAGQ